MVLLLFEMLSYQTTQDEDMWSEPATQPIQGLKANTVVSGTYCSLWFCSHLCIRTCTHPSLAARHKCENMNISLQVEQEDGALLSCALNAACAALVDAGVPLKSLFCKSGTQGLTVTVTVAVV